MHNHRTAMVTVFVFVTLLFGQSQAVSDLGTIDGPAIKSGTLGSELPVQSSAPATPTKDTTQTTEKKLNSLMIFGDGFLFTVREPDGWVGNTENADEYGGGNVVFYKSSESLEKYTRIIIVRVNSKEKKNDDGKDDLKYDMEKFKKEIPNATFKDFKMTHPIYKCYPKIYIVAGKYYEYVTYINPGDDSNIMFSATLHIDKRDANKDELEAYNKVVDSLRVISTSFRVLQETN